MQVVFVLEPLRREREGRRLRFEVRVVPRIFLFVSAIPFARFEEGVFPDHVAEFARKFEEAACVRVVDESED